jgi:predicted transcriptional regulator
MRRSKLEMYVDILEVLASKGPLKMTHIMYKANVNCKILKGYLDFLIDQGLIEEHVVGRSKVVYANTVRGVEVLKFFRELDKMLPVLEEDSKILLPLG